ncbi:hypothetical protein [Pseudonocardia cypriaca]|uniref:Uncharacterized protein n=1 Tax=Pseudonocardia cypriaca TaxID=882449 RepID=A0A543GE94_9PSEU|nr:hypothetical protein [Pseudonocardia cypriaca]TQM44400.1 hypothetical protein FB388_1765 [Pseudonocardia cypriaca]
MITAVVVVADVSCPSCSQIARELPDLLRVPVTVRSCRDPRLPAQHPTLPVTVLACRKPALGTVRGDGSLRWWTGLAGAVGVLPVVRPRALREAVGLLWTALRARRR